MSKFAAQAPRSGKAAVPTTNKAGGSAFQQDLKTELVSHFLTSLVEDKYYESAGQGIHRVQELLQALAAKGEEKFVAKAAIFARQEFHMRSITHLAAGLLGKYGSGSAWARPFYSRVVERVDDVPEILSAYLTIHGKPIPNAMKRGLGDALRRFDEYSLAKYRGGSGKLSLIDAVNLVHPGKTDALTKLMTGTLPPADTWEVGLSAAGADDNAKAEVWVRLLQENKLGYMAALRNIRNITQQAPQAKEQLFALLTDPEKVAKSKQFPYRFWSAMKVARKEGLGNDVIRALDTALGLACANVPKLSGSTLVAVDFSASMDNPVSAKSDMSMREIASLLGCILARHNDSDFMYFGDVAKSYPIHPTDSVMGQMAAIHELNRGGGFSGRHDGHHVGHGTNLGSVFDRAGSKAYDRVLIFSDMQSWGHRGDEFANYRGRSGATPYIYSCDLRGHGSSQFNTGDPRLFMLAGWSDKIFNLIGAAEVGVNVLIENVERIEI